MIIEARNLKCERRILRDEISAVRNVTLGFDARILTLLHGAAGCGKNLLIRMLGLLEPPEAGEVLVRGKPTATLDGKAREELRNRHFGFVFGEPFLLPTMTVLENIAMPLFRIAAADTEQARVRTVELLEFIGLPDDAATWIEELPCELQQRVAFARALAHKPDAIIVEDVDSQLDGEDLFAFTKLVWKACTHFNVLTIVTARDAGLAPLAHRVIEMENGAILSDTSRQVPA
jgi:ABC-type lipoprotein export system ATPase subunit